MPLDVLFPLILGIMALALWGRTHPSFPHLRFVWHCWRSPSLRGSMRRLRRPPRSPHAAWRALVHERDALHARNIAPLEPGGPQAVAMAISMLSWNALVLRSVHMDVRVAPQNADNHHRMVIVGAVVAATIAPDGPIVQAAQPDSQRMLLQDAALIRETLHQHDRAFGRHPSVSWAVFTTLALEHALPGAHIRPTLLGDPIGTAWARSLVARDPAGRLPHHPPKDPAHDPPPQR